VSGKPIAELMSSWTEQMGHPVVTGTYHTIWSYVYIYIL
jgi:aminopeptidase N